jgi:hypothetical protein
MSMMLFQTAENELITKYGHYLFSQAWEKLDKKRRKGLVNGETSHSQFFIAIYIEIDSRETALFRTQSRKLLSEIICIFSFLFPRQKTNECF